MLSGTKPFPGSSSSVDVCRLETGMPNGNPTTELIFGVHTHFEKPTADCIKWLNSEQLPETWATSGPHNSQSKISY